MKTNFEILNYLYISSPRLGNLYKKTGKNPLPKDFVFDQETITERFLLNQLSKQISYPKFIENKNSVKNCLKNSIKNIKYLQKINKTGKFSKDFIKKLDLYLKERLFVTKQILKESTSQTFNEYQAFQEIFDLNPIFANILESLYAENFDFEQAFLNLEDKYTLTYLEKTKLLEKKKSTEIQSNFIQEKTQEKIIAQNIKNRKETKIEENSIKNSKKIEKNIKKSVKTVKEKE